MLQYGSLAREVLINTFNAALGMFVLNGNTRGPGVVLRWKGSPLKTEVNENEQKGSRMNSAYALREGNM